MDQVRAVPRSCWKVRLTLRCAARTAFPNKDEPPPARPSTSTAMSKPRVRSVCSATNPLQENEAVRYPRADRWAAIVSMPSVRAWVSKSVRCFDGYRPVKRDAWLGSVQQDAAYARSYRMPSAAIRSMWGVVARSCP